MKKLSIIIPHYNDINGLRRLLSTIPDCEEIQIIVVDDKSNYEVSQLEDLILAVKKQRHNLEFYKNTCVGKSAGTCRNIGLKHAVGEWLLFADSDDYFLADFYDILQRHFYSQSDIIYFKPTSINLSTNQVGTRHILYCDTIEKYLAYDATEYDKLQLRYKINGPVSKLIRRSVVKENGIWFDEVMVSNDEMFSTQCGYYADAIEASRESIYCITHRENSLITQMTEENFLIRLDVFIRKYHFLKKNLSKKDFRELDISAQEKIFALIQNKYGLCFCKKVISLLLKNRVRFLTLKSVSPKVIIKKLKMAKQFLKKEVAY